MARTFANFLQRVLGRQDSTRRNPEDDRYAAAYINWQLEQQMLRQDPNTAHNPWR